MNGVSHITGFDCILLWSVMLNIFSDTSVCLVYHMLYVNHLLVICLLQKNDYSDSLPFLNGLFVVWLLSYTYSLFTLDINPHLTCTCKYFIPFHRLPLHALFLLLCRTFAVWCSPTYLFLLLFFELLVLYAKNCCLDQCQGTFSVFF